MKRTRLALRLCIPALLLAAPVRAQDTTCQTLDCGHVPPPCDNGSAPPDSRLSVVTYHPREDVGACRADGTCGDPRADCNAAHRCIVRLRGQVWVPAGEGPFPAVILNHGSAECADGTPRCTHDPTAYNSELKKYFFDRGYVVFEPSRRGYFPSSGLYFKDLVARQMGNGECDFQTCSTRDLDAEVQDVGEAQAWLSVQPYVKKDADGHAVMGLMGHSLGGIVTLGLNACGADVCHIRATVAISPGAESWCGDVSLQDKMKEYVSAAGAPLYILDTLNDVSTAPVIELSQRLGETDHVYQAGLFAKVVEDGHVLTCGADAHVCFARDPAYVGRWAPTVLAFLQRFGVK